MKRTELKAAFRQKACAILRWLVSRVKAYATLIGFARPRGESKNQNYSRSPCAHLLHPSNPTPLIFPFCDTCYFLGSMPLRLSTLDSGRETVSTDNNAGNGANTPISPTDAEDNHYGGARINGLPDQVNDKETAAQRTSTSPNDSEGRKKAAPPAVHSPPQNRKAQAKQTGQPESKKETQKKNVSPASSAVGQHHQEGMQQIVHGAYVFIAKQPPTQASGWEKKWSQRVIDLVEYSRKKSRGYTGSPAHNSHQRPTAQRNNFGYITSLSKVSARCLADQGSLSQIRCSLRGY